MQSGALPARPKDVKTLDAILHSMYAIISGPAGQKRDWQRFRSLFLPDARFILAVKHQDAKPKARVLDLDAYIRRTRPIFAVENFWESEVSRKTQRFGNIAHVFSTYESRRKENGAPFQRGINSIQLFYDDTRWWIATVMWNTGRD